MAGEEKGMGSFHCAPVSVITAPSNILLPQQQNVVSVLSYFHHRWNQPHTLRGTTAGGGTPSVEALPPAS